MTATGSQVPSSAVHWLLTVAGTAGIAALFLPFSWSISPIDATLEMELREDLWRLAAPCFLAVLASAASARWIVSGSLLATEQAIAYVISASMACVTLSLVLELLFSTDEQPVPFYEWLGMLLPLPILALGAYALARNSRHGRSVEFKPVMAIEGAYLAHAVMLLMLFFVNWDLGAWFVLTAVLAYTLQIILVSMHTVSRSQDQPS